MCKPMPKYWHDRREAMKFNSDNETGFFMDIVADKKPYFMIYIYPALMREYKDYIKKTSKNVLRRFGITLDELLNRDDAELNDEQKEFIEYYHKFLPVGEGSCIMNKICRRFEETFDKKLAPKTLTEEFDYSVMKSERSYNATKYYKIMKLYEEFNSKIRSLSIIKNTKRMDKNDCASAINIINNGFEKDCSAVCSNDEELCNILLDICYKRNSTKRFVWSMCGKTIIKNLLNKNDNYIQFPKLSDNGDIYYAGNTYEIIGRNIGVCV